jgi:hypothetical protein
VLPDDPTGIAEPHDVLAAEDFPMPAPRHSGALSRTRAGETWGARLRVMAGVALGLLVARRLRRR